MMDKIRSSELFELSDSIIAPLFSRHEYPWEMLPEIKGFISELIKANPMSYKEYSDGVLIGEDVKISENATIEPPCIICDKTEVRPGAYIRGSVFIGRGCVIGNSTELKNCIILDGAQIPHYNYVGDSVLGNRAHLGAGSICSNLKADKTNVVIRGEEDHETGLRKLGAILGDGADVGCNCVLNPGTVIGRNTNVYPSVSLRGVIPENMIVKAADKIVDKK